MIVNLYPLPGSMGHQAGDTMGNLVTQMHLNACSRAVGRNPHKYSVNMQTGKAHAKPSQDATSTVVHSVCIYSFIIFFFDC